MDINNKNNKDLLSLMEKLKREHTDIKNKTILFLSELDQVEMNYKKVLSELRKRNIVK
tara:strand:+ start:302 stop:475 length:174 start_codon:yes stop_codon:yes gene_type:complete